MSRHLGDSLTVFTIPKPFEGKYGIMQENAIRSWQLVLRPKDIFLFGAEEDIGKDCKRLGCARKGIRLNQEFGVPRIDATFERAQRDAVTSLMAFINTDMIFGPEILGVIGVVVEKFERFLIVGQKTDVDFITPVDFSDEAWWEKLRSFALEKGILHGKCGLDYFIFPRGKVYLGSTDQRLSPKTADGRIQPYMIGRKTWDNALMWIAALQGIPVIDATKAVLAFHPHVALLRVKSGPPYDYNRRLGGKAGRYGRTNLATLELTEECELRER
jgi:hypothetical protein